jgi:flagella basal body P-ring formation protein FlgA
MNLKQSAIFLLGFLVLAVLSVHADSKRQSLTSIALQAEAFIADYPFESSYPVSYQLSSLDQRLRLKPCLRALDIHFTHPDRISGNTSLSIQCQTPVKWRLHLPVRIDLYDDVALNRSPLVRGQTIDSGNIVFRKKKITALNQGYFTRDDSFERLQARRNLPSGSILTPANVAEKKLVTSGQMVNILLNIKGLRIKSSGKALQSATLGQVIKVKNLQSNKVIQATVSGDGEVQVRF